MLYKLSTSESYFTTEEAKKLETLGFQFLNNKWLKYDKKIIIEPNYIEIADLDQLNNFIFKYGNVVMYDNNEISITGVRK